MIVEERIYTFAPGKLALYLEAYQRDGLELQCRHLGQLLGYFTTEIGELNQVVHLWGYTDLNDRAARRAALAKEEAWNAYLRTIQPYVTKMENKLLVPTAFSPIR